MNGPQLGILYPDIDILVVFYQDHARLRGFVFVKRSVTKTKYGEYVLLACHSGGNPNDTKKFKKRVAKLTLMP